ncbi:MAG: hypothetical protein ACE15E_16175 [Acidobacteriota bacterium]
MQRKGLSEVDKLTKVAGKLFLLHQKGVRFDVNQAGRLVVEYVGDYRCSHHEEAFLAAQTKRILFLLPYWRVKLFHSLMTPEDVGFLNRCNINLELPEDSELRSPVTLPSFEIQEQKS